MPLIILSGIPASGKSTVASKLKEYFEDVAGDTETLIVSEHTWLGRAKNEIFRNAVQEKTLRDNVKSETLRLIGPERIVILDGLNYIKGFRYELYCASKANKTTQCTIHCDISPEDAWNLNMSRSADERYSRDVFNEINMRYEAPIGHNRWDSPLFLVLLDGKIPLYDIKHAVLGRNPPPPNKSTQNPPLASANYLHQLDRVTKHVVESVLEAIQTGVRNAFVVWHSGTEVTLDLRNIHVTEAEMLRCRRRFIVYAKGLQIDAGEPAKIASLFSQYLRKSILGETDSLE